MSVTVLMKDVSASTVGQETSLRIIGTREPPGHMAVQIAVQGTAEVQIQGRIARDAPWFNMGPAHSISALIHIHPVQFLRAVANDVAAGSTVSVWAVWAW
jgi:hypothetical protein